MRRPFEVLVELIADLDDWDITLGELSEALDEPMGRITDAIDAHKMMRGERTYYGLRSSEDRAGGS